MTASLSSSSPGKPLRLKDFLKEDANSDSCGGARGFEIMPRRLPDQSVRYLLAVELGESSGGERPLNRCHSKVGALTKITAVINAMKMLPFASSTTRCNGDNCDKPLPKPDGFLSRSFSRKLRRSFWRKREKGEHRVQNNAVRTILRVKDIVRLRSFGDDRRGVLIEEKAGPRSPPSPVRSTNSSSSSSSGGAWSDTDSFSCGSSVCCGEVKDGSPNANNCASPRSPCLERRVGEDSTSKSTCYREPKVKEEETGGGKGMVSRPSHFEEEKDQLSPVSVMDFPFDEDEDESVHAARAAPAAASPTSFHRSLVNLERTKHQLLQKIREFENLAALLDPVNLDSRFASTEGEDEPDRAVHKGEVHEADEQLLRFQVDIEERAFVLLRELKRRGGSGSPGERAGGGGSVEVLLLDFFIERLSCSRLNDVCVDISVKRRLDRAVGKSEEDEEAALLRAAEDWIGACWRGVEVNGWEAEVREMELDGRWRCAHVDEEEEIAGDLGGHVLESLVDELMVDLLQNN